MRFGTQNPEVGLYGCKAIGVGYIVLMLIGTAATSA